MSNSLAIDPITISSTQSPKKGLENLSSLTTIRDQINQALSQIEKAAALDEKPTALVSAPVLEPPVPYRRIIENVLEIEKICGDFIEINQNQIQMNFKILQELEKEEALKLKEASSRAQESSFWKFLQDIASFFTAVFSVVFGLPLIATGAGTLIGGAMVIAGILSITNIIFKHTDTWNWIAKKIAGDNEELAKNLAIIFPAVVGVVSGVIGLAGSAGAFFFSTLDFGEKIFVVAQTAAKFAEGIVSIVSGYTEARSKWTEAEITEIQGKSQIHQSKMEYLMMQMQLLFEEQSKIQEGSSALLNAEIQSIQIITHQIA